MRILTDEQVWKNISDSGYRYAWENFRLSKIVDRSLEEYERILKEVQ